jgi:hypothetical protein
MMPQSVSQSSQSGRCDERQVKWSEVKFELVCILYVYGIFVLFCSVRDKLVKAITPKIIKRQNAGRL